MYFNQIFIIAILFFLYNIIIKEFNYHNNKCTVSRNILLNNNYTNVSASYESIINKYIRASIIWPIWNKIKFRPNMTAQDLQVFSCFMNPKNVYFEYGSGGSTNLASYYKVKTYTVDSDINWHKKLKNNGIKVNYITIDLNASFFGYPGENTNLDDWKKYIQAYKKEYNADIILIDGRFRVACILDLFSKIRNDTIILFHDYVYRRKYHIIENFFI